MIKKLREDAQDIFQAGVSAADPYLAVKQSLCYQNNTLKILLDPEKPDQIRSEAWNSVYLIAFGKAACSMIKAAQEIIPDHLLAAPGMAVTNYENATTVDQVDVFSANHPLPDLAGLNAANAITTLVTKAQKNDLVLVLISGGGSALLPFPVDSISLDEKIATTDLLLASGATINEINCVRKHLSKMKGGGLARMAAPASLHALILSDVIGDDLSAIASGPTVPDTTTFSDAVNICQSKNIWYKLPDSVRIVLSEGASGKIIETPKPEDPMFQQTGFTLIGSNKLSLIAAVNTAASLNYHTQVYNDQLCGEARDQALQLVLFIKKIICKGLTKPFALLAGGETTVTLTGHGKGGRNQEFALAFTIAAKQHQLPENWVFLSAGTDGRDGPTDAAGGLIDYGTYHRIIKSGVNPASYLQKNDSYTALSVSQDLLTIEATGTNVADLQVLLILP